MAMSYSYIPASNCSTISGSGSIGIALDAQNTRYAAGTISYASCPSPAWALSIQASSMSVGTLSLSSVAIAGSFNKTANLWYVAANATTSIDAGVAASVSVVLNAGVSYTALLQFSVSQPSVFTANASLYYATTSNGCSYASGSANVVATIGGAGSTKSNSNVGYLSWTNCSGTSYYLSAALNNDVIGPVVLSQLFLTASKTSSSWSVTANASASVDSVSGFASLAYNSTGALSLNISAQVIQQPVLQIAYGALQYSSPYTGCSYLTGQVVVITQLSSDSGNNTGSGFIKYVNCSGVTSWLIGANINNAVIGPVTLTSLNLVASRAGGYPSWSIVANASASVDSVSGFASLAYNSTGALNLNVSVAVFQAPVNASAVLSYSSAQGCKSLIGSANVIVKLPESDSRNPISSVGQLSYSQCGNAGASWYLSFSTGGETLGVLTLNSLVFTASRASNTSGWLITSSGVGTFDNNYQVTGMITYFPNNSFTVIVGLVITPSDSVPIGMNASITYYKGGLSVGTSSLVAVYGGHTTTAIGVLRYNPNATGTMADPRWYFSERVALGEVYSGVTITNVGLNVMKLNATSNWIVNLNGNANLGGAASSVSITVFSRSNYNINMGLLVSNSFIFLNVSFSFIDSTGCSTISGTGKFSVTLDNFYAGTTLSQLTYNSCTNVVYLEALGTTMNIYGFPITIQKITLTYSNSSNYQGNVIGTISLPISGATETTTVGFNQNGISFFSASVSPIQIGFGSLYGGLYINKCATSGWNVMGTVSMAVDLSSFGTTVSGIPTGPYTASIFRSCDGSQWGASFLIGTLSVGNIQGSAMTFQQSSLTYTHTSTSNSIVLNGTLTTSNSPLLLLQASLVKNSDKTTVSVAAIQYSSCTFNDVYKAMSGTDFSVGSDPTGALGAIKGVTISNTVLSFDITLGARVTFCIGLDTMLSNFAGVMSSISAGVHACVGGGSPAFVLYVMADLSRMGLGSAQSSIGQMTSSMSLSSAAIVLTYGTFAGTSVMNMKDLSPTFSMYNVLNLINSAAPSGCVALVAGISIGQSKAKTGGGFATFMNTLSTSQNGGYSQISTTMQSSDTQMQVSLNLILSMSGSFTAVISLSNIPMGFGGVTLYQLQLKMALSPTSVAFSLLMAFKFSISGQPILAVGEFSFIQYAGATALGITLQIANGALPGVNPVTSNKYTQAANLLPGQSLWMNPFNVGDRIGIILPITFGMIIGVTDSIPPVPVPLQIQFSGGIAIGRTSASIAMLINIPNMQIALAATITNFSPGIILEDVFGCDGCLGAAMPFLNKFFSVQSIYFSFNPLGTVVSVGTSISSVIILPGLTLRIHELWLFDIFHLLDASFTISSSGISASIAMAPIVLIPNYVEIRALPPGPMYFDLPGSDIAPYNPPQDDSSFCNSRCMSLSNCKAWVYASPRTTVSCPRPQVSTPTCYMKSSSTMAPVANGCVLSQIVDIGTGNVRQSTQGPFLQFDFATSSLPSLHVSAAIYVFGVELGLVMNINSDATFNMIAFLVAPSILNLGFSMAGTTYNPATWTASVTASVDAAEALRQGIAIIRNGFNIAVNKMKSALGAFNDAQNALTVASNALDSVQQKVRDLSATILAARQSAQGQLDCYHSHMNQISDCLRHFTIWCGFGCSCYCNPIHCNWHGCHGGDCHCHCWDNWCSIPYYDIVCLAENAYHATVAGVCWAAYQIQIGILDAAAAALSAATDVALKAAQLGLSAASAAVSATKTAYQGAIAVVGAFGGALTAGLQWFLDNALVIQYISLSATVGRSAVGASITIGVKIGSDVKVWTLGVGDAYQGVTPDAIIAFIVSNCKSVISSIGISLRRRLQEQVASLPSRSIDQTMQLLPPALAMSVGTIARLVPTSMPTTQVSWTDSMVSHNFADVLAARAANPSYTGSQILAAGLVGSADVTSPALLNVTSSSLTDTYVNLTTLQTTIAANTWMDPATTGILVGDITDQTFPSYFLPGTPSNLSQVMCYNGICGLAALSMMKLVTYIPDDSYLCTLAPDIHSLRLDYMNRVSGVPGPLPQCVLSYNSSEHFSFEYSHINGTIDMFMNSKSMLSLTSLSVNHNLMTGSIPPSFSSALPALQYLNLQNNYFTGNLSFLLNSNLNEFYLDGNQFTESSVPYLLSTMPSLRKYSMVQQTYGIPYVSRAVVPVQGKTRVAVILNINPNITALCGFPAGADNAGSAYNCHNANMPISCAASSCAAGATALGSNLTAVLLPPEGGVLGSINSVFGFDNAVTILPVSATQWIVRYEVDYYYGVPAGFSTADAANQITALISDGLNASYSSTLTSVSVVTLCSPGRFSPDCSVFCPTSWQTVDLNTLPVAYNASLPQPKSVVRNMTRNLLDTCNPPPACVGYTGVCDAAIRNMNYACDFYMLGDPSTGNVNVSTMAQCCSLASAAMTACSPNNANEPGLPNYCQAVPMGISSRCAAMPAPRFAQSTTPVGWSYNLRLNDDTNSLSVLFGSDSLLSEGVLNAFVLDVAGLSGVLPTQVTVASITDNVSGLIRRSVIANVTVTPARTPSITSSVTPSSTASSAPTVSSSNTASPSFSPTRSNTPSSSASVSITASPSSSVSMTYYPTPSSSSAAHARMLATTGSSVTIVFQIIAVSQGQADLIAAFNSASAKEGQFTRGLAALAAATAGKSVPAFDLQRTAVIGGTNSAPADTPAVSATSLLSGGAIAGIVIAIVAFAAIIGAIVYIAIFKNKTSVKNELVVEPEPEAVDVESSEINDVEYAEDSKSEHS
jgi:PAN domain